MATVTINEMDRRARRLSLRITAGQRGESTLPDRLDLLRTFAISAAPIPDAIMAVIEDQLGPRTNRAAEDLLSRASPRMAAPSIQMKEAAFRERLRRRNHKDGTASSRISNLRWIEQFLGDLDDALDGKRPGTPAFAVCPWQRG